MEVTMKKLAVLLLLIFFSDTFAQGLTIIYKGQTEGRSITAISVSKVYKPKKLDKFVARLLTSKSTLLIYHDYKKYQVQTPLAVYIDSVRTSYATDQSKNAKSPTIGSIINRSYRQGGRTGAICRDGTRSSATGRGACSHHKGVSRWLHSKTKDTSAIIGSICEDFTLMAGKKTACAKKSKVLAYIKNRTY